MKGRKKGDPNFTNDTIGFDGKKIKTCKPAENMTVAYSNPNIRVSLGSGRFYYPKLAGAL